MCEDKDIYFVIVTIKQLRERIRQETNDAFRWNEFVKLITDDVSTNCFGIQNKKAREYASDRLQLLGSSSRDVFTLTSKSALKIANSQQGVEQNKIEYLTYSQLSTTSISSHITKVLRVDDAYAWLVSELVNPVNKKQFENIIGFNEDELEDMCDYDINKRTVFVQNDTKHHKYRGKNRGWFLKLLERFEHETRIDVGDLVTHRQWGLNTSGELVLLDYGIVS